MRPTQIRAFFVSFLILAPFILAAQDQESVRITLRDETLIRADLLAANDDAFLVYNQVEDVQQIIARDDVLYMDTHLDVDLRTVETGTPDLAQDRVFLLDGGSLDCTILELTPSWIAYTAQGGTDRRIVRSQDLEYVLFGSRRIPIPFSGQRSLASIN